MMAIWKYPLEITDKQIIRMWIGARILSVVNIDDEVVMYAETETTKDMGGRTIYIVGTGHEIPVDSEMRFIGTVTMHNGRLVWHIFEGRSIL